MGNAFPTTREKGEKCFSAQTRVKERDTIAAIGPSLIRTTNLTVVCRPGFETGVGNLVGVPSTNHLSVEKKTRCPYAPLWRVAAKALRLGLGLGGHCLPLA